MKKSPKGIGRKEILRAVADYMQSEGCSCCRSDDRHEEAKNRLAKLLGVPMHKDKSGFDFYRFCTEPL